MEILNARNVWVSLLNVSLEMHADVIARRQFNQTWNWKKERNFNEWKSNSTML